MTVYSRPFYAFSFAFTLVSKTVIVFYMLSEGDYGFLNWRNKQELVQVHRNRVFRQLTFAIITFKIGRNTLKRSVLSFLIFTIVAIKLMTIQVKLVKLARSLQPLKNHIGPVRLAACLVMAAGFFYLRLLVEVSWAMYYLWMLCKNPPVKDMVWLLLGLVRLLDWK